MEINMVEERVRTGFGMEWNTCRRVRAAEA
jgi:hypothetical protein